MERAFGHLMGKFRRLKFHPHFSLALGIDHIMASLVLNNFIILEGEEPQVSQHPSEHRLIIDHSEHDALMLCMLSTAVAWGWSSHW